MIASTRYFFSFTSQTRSKTLPNDLMFQLPLEAEGNKKKGEKKNHSKIYKEGVVAMAGKEKQ